MEANEYELRREGKLLSVVVDGLVFPFGFHEGAVYGLDEMSKEEFKEYYEHF